MYQFLFLNQTSKSKNMIPTNRITKNLFWLGKRGFTVGALLGGYAAIHLYPNPIPIQVISATISYGVVGYIIGVTAPVSFPLMLMHYRFK